MRALRGEVSHAQSYAEKDLTAGVLPDLTISKCVRSPRRPGIADALGGVRKRNATPHQDDHHEDRKAHREVHDSAGLTDAPPNAKPDQEPGKGTPAGRFPNQANTGIAGVTLDRAARNLARRALSIADDVLHVEVLAVAFPGQGALKGISKICHGPGQDWDIVEDDHVSIVDQAESDALQSLLYMIIGDRWATAKGLTNRDLQSESWNSQKEEGDEVWDEPL